MADIRIPTVAIWDLREDDIKVADPGGNRFLLLGHPVMICTGRHPALEAAALRRLAEVAVQEAEALERKAAQWREDGIDG